MSRQKRTIALDFDGVLHRYNGWKDGFIDGPVEGAKEAVASILADGHTVVVFSTRDPDVIRGWLAQYGFPPLEVTSVKRPFYVIVDDRAIRFDGVWSAELLHKIRHFEPYWIMNRRNTPQT